MSKKAKSPSSDNTLIAAALGLIGVAVTAYFGYLGLVRPHELSIEATRVAEERLTVVALSATPSPSTTSTTTSTPTVSATNTPKPISTATATNTSIPTPTLPCGDCTSVPTLTPTQTKRPTPTLTPCLNCTPIPTPIPTQTKRPTPTPDCIYHISDGKGGTVPITLTPPLRVSKIIISMTQKNSPDPQWGYSLLEVEAYGDDLSKNLALARNGGTAQGSTTQENFVATRAIDGDRKDPSRWGSNPEPGITSIQQLTITLPSAQLVNTIVLYWERAYAVAYDVCVIHD